MQELKSLRASNSLSCKQLEHASVRAVRTRNISNPKSLGCLSAGARVSVTQEPHGLSPAGSSIQQGAWPLPLRIKYMGHALHCVEGLSPDSRSEMRVSLALLGSPALRAHRLWLQVRQQHKAVESPLYLKKERHQSVRALGAQPRDPQEMPVPLPIQKSHISPRRAAQEGHLLKPSVKEGAFHPHCVHRSCTHKHWAVPSTTQNCWQWDAAGPDPNNLVHLSRTPFQAPSPPNTRHKSPGRGFGLGGCDSSPHGTDPPLPLFVPPAIFTQHQERQQEQNQPSQPSEGIECLSITLSEGSLAVLGFSHPGQQ